MNSISNSVNMSFRVDKKLKKEADILFKNLGLNTSVALNMFLTQSVREKAIPFKLSMNVPKQDLLDAVKEVDNIEKGIKKVKGYDNVDHFIKDMLDK